MGSEEQYTKNNQKKPLLQASHICGQLVSK